MHYVVSLAIPFRFPVAAVAASLALLTAGTPAPAQQTGTETPASAPISERAQQTYQEIEQTLGTVPTFMKAFPEAGIPGAWEEFKAIQLSQDTALSGKEKELIGLAVAAQIPCDYCVYAHREFAMMHGATEQEVQEAIAMAAIVRHWSTVLNGSQISFKDFQNDIAQITQTAQQASGQAPGQTPETAAAAGGADQAPQD